MLLYTHFIRCFAVSLRCHITRYAAFCCRHGRRITKGQFFGRKVLSKMSSLNSFHSQFVDRCAANYSLREFFCWADFGESPNASFSGKKFHKPHKPQNPFFIQKKASNLTTLGFK